MGGIVLNNNYKTTLLEQLRAKLGTFLLHLFQNDCQPVGRSVYTDFQEASFPGYSVQPLTGWTVPYLNACLDAQTDPSLVSWTMSGSSPSNYIYGYFVTDPLLNVVWSQIDPNGPILLGGPGAVYGVVASFTFGQLLSGCGSGSGSGSGSGEGIGAEPRWLTRRSRDRQR